MMIKLVSVVKVLEYLKRMLLHQVDGEGGFARCGRAHQADHVGFGGGRIHNGDCTRLERKFVLDLTAHEERAYLAHPDPDTPMLVYHDCTDCCARWLPCRAATHSSLGLLNDD